MLEAFRTARIRVAETLKYLDPYNYIERRFNQNLLAQFKIEMARTIRREIMDGRVAVTLGLADMTERIEAQGVLTLIRNGDLRPSVIKYFAASVNSRA